MGLQPCAAPLQAALPLSKVFAPYRQAASHALLHYGMAAGGCPYSPHSSQHCIPLGEVGSAGGLQERCAWAEVSWPSTPCPALLSQDVKVLYFLHFFSSPEYKGSFQRIVNVCIEAVLPF